MFYVSPAVDKRAKRAISLSHRKGKSAPSFSFSLPRSTSETDGITFPGAAPHPLVTCFLSKLPNFTSHQLQSQLNNPRKSHSSGVLQHTGSDTCGWSSSSFLPWSWTEGAGPAGGASHSETGTSGWESAPAGSQSGGTAGLTDSRASQWRPQPPTLRTLRRKCERWRMTDRRESVWRANSAGGRRANEINEFISRSASATTGLYGNSRDVSRPRIKKPEAFCGDLKG